MPRAKKERGKGHLRKANTAHFQQLRGAGDALHRKHKFKNFRASAVHTLMLIHYNCAKRLHRMHKNGGLLTESTKYSIGNN